MRDNRLTMMRMRVALAGLAALSCFALSGGTMTTAANGVVTVTGTPDDPYVLTEDLSVKGTPGELVYVGFTGEEGALDVRGATLEVPIDKDFKEIRFGASGSDATRTATRSTTVVSNGTIKGCHLVFSGYGTNDGSTKGQELNTVRLDAGGSLVGQLIVYDDPVTRLAFNGGFINPIDYGGAHKRAYDGSRAVFQIGGSSVSVVEAAAGHDINIVNDQALALAACGSNTGGVRLTGAGGFRKRGSGELKVGDPSVMTLDYVGDTTLEAGTVRLYGDDLFPFGTGKGRLVLAGAELDLNGHALSVNALDYTAGVVSNDAATTATLAVGADGSDSAFAAPLVGNVRFAKRGAGELRFAAKGPSSVAVEAGTLALKAAATYRHFRFKVLKPRGTKADCVIVSEFRLLDFGADVTRPYATVSRSGTGKDGAGWSWKGVSEGPECAVDGSFDTKFTDHNAATDGSASGELRDQCWLQIDYAEPRRVTAYNWATAADYYNDSWKKDNESLCRNPSGWQLLGSDDGANWTLLDERTDYYWSAAKAKSWTPSPFETGVGALDDSAVTVAAGATLTLTGAAPCVGTLDNRGDVALDDGARLTVGGGVAGGTFSANATVVKAGDGTLALAGKAPSNLRIAGGEVLALTGAVAYAHYRFKPTWVSGGQAKCLQFSEFKLLMNGVDVTQGFVSVTNSPQSSVNKGEEPDKAVDGSLETKFTDLKGKATHQTLTDCWLQLDYAEPRAVSAYTWATGNDCANPNDNSCRNPIDWELQGSCDGETWTTLDVRKGYRTYVGTKKWINDTFAVGADWAGSVARSVVQVDAGASLDLTRAGDTLTALKIDLGGLGQGMATIRGGRIAETGTIALVNANGQSIDNLDLALAFEGGEVLTDAFKGWTLTVDGQATDRKVKVVGGRLKVAAVGLAVMLK